MATTPGVLELEGQVQRLHLGDLGPALDGNEAGGGVDTHGHPARMQVAGLLYQIRIAQRPRCPG